MSTPNPHTLLLAFLADNDVNCPMCTYNLRGLENDQCPECGETLSLTVRPESYNYGPYIASVLGLAIGVGFFGILTIWLIIMLIQGVETLDSDMVVIFANCTLETVLLIFLIRFNRRFRCAAPNTQAAIATGSWLLTAICATIFFALIP